MAGPEALLQVIARPAAAADRALIAGLMQFYTYDFSEMEPAASPRFDVEPDGLYARYPPLDRYWAEPHHWPILIEADGRPAGFALINSLSQRGGAPDRNMAEYFIARKYRRIGAGRRALQQILACHPGHWEVAVAGRNHVAAAFWPRALQAAGVSGLQAHRGDGEAWIGEIWAFEAGPAL